MPAVISTSFTQAKEPRCNTLERKVVLTELYDATMMDAILADTNTFSQKDLNKLKRYKKARKGPNSFEAVYKYDSVTDGVAVGRMYSNGLQSFPKDIRNALTEKLYWDVDMENQAFRCALELTEKYNLKNETLKYFVNNRKKCYDDVSSDRSTAKRAFTAVLFGGDILVYNQNYKTEEPSPDPSKYNTQDAVLKALKSEIDCLTNYVYGLDEYRVYRKIVERQKKVNPRASVLSRVIQSIEEECIESIREFMTLNGRSVDVKIFDGCLVRKKDGEYEFPVDMLREAEKYVQKTTGHTLVLAVKPIENNYKPLDAKDDIVVIDNDAEAVSYLHANYGNRIVRTPDEWYVHMKGDNWWSIGKSAVCTLIKQCKFYKRKDNGNLVAYSENSAGIKNIFSLLSESTDDLFPVNHRFIDEINQKTLGKVYFRDKYYDLMLQQFFDIEEGDVVPIVYIDRDADVQEPSRDMQVKAIEIMMSIFGSVEQVKLALHAASRAIGGYYSDKVWYTINGQRNSSKGLFITILSLCFDKYVTTIDVPVAKSFNSGDASELKWVLNTMCHVARIAYSNESKTIQDKEVVLDGNTIKKVIASGGDRFSVRNLYQKETSAVFNATAFFCLNETPKSNPADAFQTMIPLITPFRYVQRKDQVVDKFDRIGDESIKDQIKQNPELIHALMIMIFHGFEVHSTKSIVLPNDSKEFLDDLLQDGMTSMPEIFRNKFKPDEDGFVTTEQLEEVFAPCKVSKEKIGRFLKKREYEKVRRRVRGVLTNGYIGFSLKQSEEDEVDEQEDDCVL